MDLTEFKRSLLEQLKVLRSDPTQAADLTAGPLRVHVINLTALACEYNVETKGFLVLRDLTTLDSWIESYKTECLHLHDTFCLQAVQLVYGAVCGYLNSELKAQSAYEADVRSALSTEQEGNALVLMLEASLREQRICTTVIFTFTKPQLH